MDYCGVQVTLNNGREWNQNSPLPADLDLKTRPGIITRSVRFHSYCISGLIVILVFMKQKNMRTAVFQSIYDIVPIF